MAPSIMGFHTESISWDPQSPEASGDSNYPLGNLTNLSVHLSTGESVRILSQIFSSPGIGSRGTCVWKGLLLSTKSTIPAGSPQTQPLAAVKYAWCQIVSLKQSCISLLPLAGFEVSPQSSPMLNTKTLVKISTSSLQPIKGIIVIIPSLS
ncbi:hypothetical protein L211DRAFT_854232 [Terfezia boudieri ATCC MYA-4762]|uniref:Uncharacterized protein n=1 Tax=Terfezia boudieri ATCC MYA-4762 TaxID=1051890 RepID=A0A3N4L647_9PEZI|nr:hypothetical protein L211DRAFT_854232 [Terfezia boudieri ATCC MYA-4762]